MRTIVIIVVVCWTWIWATSPGHAVPAPNGDLSCLVHPYTTIIVTAPVAGLLESITVDRGDLVKEGQTLAMLDTSVERASGAVAHAQAELTNRHLADLELQRTAADVSLRTIRSPINGVVVERFMSPGEFPKQEKILKLAQINPLRVEAYAPVSLLGKVSVGMEASVKMEEPVSGLHKAKVTVVDRVVDGASGTFGIRLELPNPDLKFPAGLKCTVRFSQR
jgi:membrane fusion protein (multidrug efflux system)